MDMDQVPGSLDDGGQNCSFVDWYDAFPKPRSTPPSINPDELAVLLKTKTVGKDFVVVDVRRTDFEVGFVGTRDLDLVRSFNDWGC